MVINTQDTNYSIGGMVNNTQDINYSMLEYCMLEYYNGALIYRYVGVLHDRVL